MREPMPMPQHPRPDVEVVSRRDYQAAGLNRLAPIAPLIVASILALSVATECHRAHALNVPSYSWGPSLLYGASLWLGWGVAGCVLCFAAVRDSRVLRLNVSSLVVQAGFALVLVAAHLFFMEASVRFAQWHWPFVAQDRAAWLAFFDPARVALDVFVYAFLWSSAALVRYHLKVQRDTMTALALERELSQAKLQALQSQLEPHFLFNTLNAISTLIDAERNGEASEMLAHLNIILRMTLNRSSSLKIPVSEELLVVENYLAIEQIRFSDRLRVELHVDPSALNGLVPAFVLQPLLENAIRHGIANREEDGIILTSVSHVGQELRMRVYDNGAGSRAEHQAGHGIGLRNTSQRLLHLYPDKHQLRVTSPEEGGFEVAIAIPFERATP